MSGKNGNGNGSKPPKQDPFDPDILDPDENPFEEDDPDDDQEEPSPTEDPPPKPRRSRATREGYASQRVEREGSAKELKLSETLEAQFLRLVAEAQQGNAKLDAKTAARMIRLFQKNAIAEGRRALDFMGAQRNYMYFLMQHNQQLAGQQTATQNAVLENINKIGELTKALSEAQGGSKIKEVFEVFVMILQIPIMQELQDMLMDKLEDWRDKKNKENGKPRTVEAPKKEATPENPADDLTPAE